MKINSLKSKVLSFFILIVFYQCGFGQIQSAAAQKTAPVDKKNNSEYHSTENNNRLGLPPIITGNLSICLPGLPTTQLTASAPPAPVTATTPWVSSNPAVATISSTGLVTQVSFGTTTITYTDNLGNTYSENVSVSTFPTIATTFGTSTCAGGNLQLEGSLFPNAITPWISLTPATASVDSFGLVTGVSGGPATIQYMNLLARLVYLTITYIILVALPHIQLATLRTLISIN
jgi:hypothetical protein